MSDIDFADSLVGFLRADGAVNALASTRVYAAELPVSEAATMPRYAVVVEPLGGSGPASQTPTWSPRLDITCYGATPKQARMLWFALAQALQDLRRAVYAGCLLHSAIPLMGPLQTRHPETHWPLVWGSWQMIVSTEAAS
jgi:hypothetical protein